MKDFLFPMLFDIEVLTPLHIGTTAEPLSAKAFIVDDEYVTVMDEDKLIAWASADSRRQDQFVRFAENLDARLDQFLTSYGLDARNFAAYRIRRDAPGRPNRIREFIKQPDGRPYLPGSSFKGSFRSALLRGYTLEKPDLAPQMAESVKSELAHSRRNQSGEAIGHPGGEVESLVFVPADGIKADRYPNYDLIRTIGFNDSVPVLPSRLRVYEVRVLSVQSGRKLSYKLPPRGGERPMQIFAEMLEPGTHLRLPVTVNKALRDGFGEARSLAFQERRDLTAGFPKYCRLAAANLLQQEAEFYEEHHVSALAQQFQARLEQMNNLPEDQFLISVGWGTGYDAKTVTDQLGEEVFRLVVDNYRNTIGLGKPSGSSKWLGPELSPKSRKVVFHSEGNVEPIGWLRVRLFGRQ